MKDRRELVDQLFPKRGRIVEVGVFQGAFAAEIYRIAKPELLVLVDPWRRVPGSTLDVRLKGRKKTFRQDYQQTRARVGWRVDVIMLRMLSIEAAELFRPGTFDAVYIDADHAEESVRADIEAWWPLVRSGGILSGHDYGEYGTLKGFGIVPAVNDFVDRHELELLLTDHSEIRSWAVRK